MIIIIMIDGDKKVVSKQTFASFPSQFTAILRVLCQNCIDLVIRNELQYCDQ